MTFFSMKAHVQRLNECIPASCHINCRLLRVFKYKHVWFTGGAVAVDVIYNIICNFSLNKKTL